MEQQFYVKLNDGRYLKLEGNLGDVVKTKQEATIFDDKYSAEFMADCYQLNYELEPTID